MLMKKKLKLKFFCMVTKICSNGKRHYILPVCKMACLNI